VKKLVTSEIRSKGGWADNLLRRIIEGKTEGGWVLYDVI